MFEHPSVVNPPAYTIAFFLALGGFQHFSHGQNSADNPSTLMDRVEIRQGITSNTKINIWSPLKVIVFDGEVQSFDAKNLVIRVKATDGTDSSKTISSDQVQLVRPAWRGQGTAAAVKMFEQHKYQDFVKALQALDLASIPDWQQVLLTSMVVQAREAHNLVGAAGDNFIDLAKYPIPHLVYGDMPLCWSIASGDISDKAKKWIDQESEVAKLLGASWLLLGAENQKATNVLTELQKSKTPAIAQLARTQAWRLVPVPETMARLPSWIAERDRMLRPLALGPTEFLSDRLMRIGQTDLAIGTTMQIATLYSDRFPRARRALVSAAVMLNKQQRKADADKVLAWVKQLDGTN